MLIREGYETDVRDEGDGDTPLLLIHGTPLDLAAWNPLVPLLTAEGRRVIRYDLRGHGSAAGCHVPATFAELALDAVALLDALGVGRAHVVGHSFGGEIAQEVAIDHPDRVAGLVVVCSRTSPFPPFAAAADAIDAGGAEAVDRQAMERWFTSEALADEGPGVAYARDALARSHPDAMAAAFRLIADFDASSEIASFTGPASWIAAERDLVGTPEEMGAAADLCANGHLEVVPGVGHMLPVEAPALLAASLLAAAPGP